MKLQDNRQLNTKKTVLQSYNVCLLFSRAIIVTFEMCFIVKHPAFPGHEGDAKADINVNHKPNRLQSRRATSTKITLLVMMVMPKLGAGRG